MAKWTSRDCLDYSPSGDEDCYRVTDGWCAGIDVLPRGKSGHTIAALSALVARKATVQAAVISDRSAVRGVAALLPGD